MIVSSRRLSGQRHDGAVKVLVRGAQGFLVAGGRRGFAFLDRGTDGRHPLRGCRRCGSH